jgi:phenylacetate-coenzyme A ligase PaaK-like adenylate-forming protein
MRDLFDPRLIALVTGRDRLPRDLDRVVADKLGRVLRHAATTVPWYGRLCADAGIDARAIGPRDLSRLPLTRKAHWRDRFGPGFVSDAVPLSRCRLISTSGTTGSALTMPFTLADRVARRVATQRCFWAAGVGVRKRYGWIRRPAGPASGAQPLHERLGVLRTLYLDLLTTPDRYWDRLAAWSPSALLGFPLEMESLAAWIEMGRLARLPKPVVCAVYGEAVDARTRAGIEGSLGPLREMYGSAEAGTIAWECGQGPGLHVNADMVVVELLRDGRPVPAGTPGEIVVTNLHSWAMPVIRYAQGDLGWEVPGPCPCGRPGPLMRVEPWFRLGPLRLPSGRRIAARFFVQALPSPGWLLDWQVEQPAPDRLSLRLETARAVPDEEILAIANDIARACWEPVKVEISIRVRPEGAA